MHSIFNYKRLVYVLVIVAWGLYVFLTFLAPESSSSTVWNISSTTLFLIRISIAIPYLLTWLIAALAFIRLYEYYRPIVESSDGKAFRKFFYGSGWLLASLIVGSIISAWKSYSITVPSDLMSATIVLNYVYVFFPLLGFIFFYQGAQLLRGVFSGAQSYITRSRVYSASIVVIFSVTFLWLLFTNTERQISGAVDSAPGYYLSDVFIVLTIVLPMIVGWFLGIFSAFTIVLFLRHVSGEIYRSFFKIFAFGILAVVVGSAILQLLLAVGTGRLLGLGLGPVLLIVYLFLSIQGIGYYLIVRASKKLGKLEQL